MVSFKRYISILKREYSVLESGMMYSRRMVVLSCAMVTPMASLAMLVLLSLS
jgi:hypothetical protein